MGKLSEEVVMLVLALVLGCATPEPTTEDVSLPSETEATLTARKLVLLVDDSSSVQCTDPYFERGAGIQAWVESLLDDGSIDAVAMVGFSNSVRTEPFASSWSSGMTEIVDPTYGVATDVQGALVTAAELISSDADRADTAYQVVLVTDGGSPEPVCHAGCGDGVDTLYGVCDVDEAAWATVPEDSYVDFEPCGSYNLPETLEEKVRMLADLGAGELQLGSIVMFTDEHDVCGDMLDWTIDPIYEALATVGGGTHVVIEPGEPIPVGP